MYYDLTCIVKYFKRNVSVSIQLWDRTEALSLYNDAINFYTL